MERKLCRLRQVSVCVERVPIADTIFTLRTSVNAILYNVIFTSVSGIESWAMNSKRAVVQISWLWILVGKRKGSDGNNKNRNRVGVSESERTSSILYVIDNLYENIFVFFLFIFLTFPFTYSSSWWSTYIRINFHS